VRINHPTAATRLLTNAAAWPCHDRSIALLLLLWLLLGAGAARIEAAAVAIAAFVLVEGLVAALIAVLARVALGEEAGPAAEALLLRRLPVRGTLLFIILLSSL